MTEEKFWSLIDHARHNPSDEHASADEKRLENELKKLSDEDVMGFGTMFYEKICALNSWKLWGAGYLLAGGMSDDSFHYFRSWVVGRGQQAYETALNNPDNLVDFVGDVDVLENEALEYAALDVLEARGIEVDPRDEAEGDADGDPSGEEWDEDDLEGMFPRISQFLNE